MTRAQSPLSFPRWNRGVFLALPALLCLSAAADVPIAQVPAVAAFW